MVDKSLCSAVRSFKDGNKSSFKDIYLLSYKLVFYRANRILKNDQDSYDIVQAVYIKLYNKIYQLSDEEKFISWILTMTDNECKNLLKSHKRSIQFSVMDDDDMEFVNNIADSSPDPTEAADSSELGLQIRSLIECLPPEQQKVIEMYYYEQKSVEEIAAITACSLGTVKSRLNYGRKNMRKSIEKYEKCNSVKLYSSVMMWIISDIKSYFAAAAMKTAAVAAAAAVITTQAVVSTEKKYNVPVAPVAYVSETESEKQIPEPFSDAHNNEAQQNALISEAADDSASEETQVSVSQSQTQIESETTCLSSQNKKAVQSDGSCVSTQIYETQSSCDVSQSRITEAQKEPEAETVQTAEHIFHRHNHDADNRPIEDIHKFHDDDIFGENVPDEILHGEHFNNGFENVMVPHSKPDHIDSSDNNNRPEDEYQNDHQDEQKEYKDAENDNQNMPEEHRQHEGN